MDKNNAARKRERRRQERKRLSQGELYLRMTPKGFDMIYPMTGEIERAAAEGEAQIIADGWPWSADHAKFYRGCGRVRSYDPEAFMRGITSKYWSDVLDLPLERVEEVLGDFIEMGMMSRAGAGRG